MDTDVREFIPANETGIIFSMIIERSSRTDHDE